MATPYAEIYTQAMFRLQAHDLSELDAYTRDVVLNVYHAHARAEFAHICKTDLSRRDDELCEYLDDLADDEIHILALGICYEWLSAHALNSDILQNVVSTKEYSFFSNANLIREIGILRDTLKKEFRQAINDYSCHRGNLARPGVSE